MTAKEFGYCFILRVGGWVGGSGTSATGTAIAIAIVTKKKFFLNFITKPENIFFFCKQNVKMEGDLL